VVSWLSHGTLNINYIGIVRMDFWNILHLFLSLFLPNCIHICICNILTNEIKRRGVLFISWLELALRFVFFYSTGYKNRKRCEIKCNRNRILYSFSSVLKELSSTLHVENVDKLQIAFVPSTEVWFPFKPLLSLFPIFFKCQQKFFFIA
jgi:hypothetical protein